MRDFLRVLEGLPVDVRRREQAALVAVYLDALDAGGAPVAGHAFEQQLRDEALVFLAGTIGWAMTERTEGRHERIGQTLRESIVRTSRLVDDLVRA